MPKGYWIVHLDIADQSGFTAYLAANAEPLRHYGARFLARAGRHTVAEGTARSRNTIVEFPSYQAALDCWHSTGYQTARALRSASPMDLVIVEGYDAG